MAKIKSYTQEHLDAILAIRKDLREATQRIKKKPNKVAKAKKGGGPILDAPVVETAAEADETVSEE